MRKSYLEINDYRIYTSKAELHKAVNSLIGMITGIGIDGVINEDEKSEIINWCNLHGYLTNKFPFSEIIPMVNLILSNNPVEYDDIQDLLWLCNNISSKGEFKEYYDIITSSIQQLEGILQGVLADNELSDEEIIQLAKWIDDHVFLKGTYPFDEVNSLLASTLEDGIITDDERQILFAYFANFVDTRMSYNINEFDIKALQNKYSVSGICAVCPEITFENKTFCFTGASAKGTRNEIAKIIINKGSIFNNNVTKKTDYLIIGGEGNPCWAFSCYGRKVEKAVQLRKEGSTIVIVHENDFWNEIN
jgi:NAD-dependent DNA ligase